MNWCLLAEYKEREIMGLLNTKLLTSAFIILIFITIIMAVFILISNRLIIKGIKNEN